VTLLRQRLPRRLVTVPTVFVSLFLVLTTLPLWLIAAAFVSPRLPGRLRPFRLLWFAIVYLAMQAAALIAAALLWVLSGFGRDLDGERSRDRHYRLLGVLLAGLMRAARRAFALDLAVDADPPPDEQPDVPHDDPRPLLVLSRHAGPGDSFLLVHQLLNGYGRRPRVVLKATIKWDPAIDVLLHRVPSRFITPGRSGVAESIGVLAGDLGPRDALVLFPEGGNYSPERRRRSITRLEDAGQAAYARRAGGLRHLMAPRPAGTFAAVDASPDADIVFVAHCGLEGLSTPRDLWRGLPMEAEVRARFWTVAREDVPDAAAERIAWLYDWWERMDAWIEDNRVRCS
jgi:hypothetical protein